MTDRELLELAATAAGIISDGLGGCYDLEREKIWNPLTDDGDALRLAVQLGLQIKHHYYEGDYYVDVLWDSMAAVKSEPLINDHYAATRRAIVRAAAELGKG